MADFWFRSAKELVWKGSSPADSTVWPGWTGATIKVMLCTSALTQATVETATNLSAITGLTEYSSTGYVSGPGGAGRVSLASKTLSLIGSPATAVHLLAANPSWTGLGNGGSTVLSAIIYWHVSGSNDALNVPLQYRDSGGFSNGFTFNNSNFTINFPVSGIGIIS